MKKRFYLLLVMVLATLTSMAAINGTVNQGTNTATFYLLDKNDFSGTYTMVWNQLGMAWDSSTASNVDGYGGTFTFRPGKAFCHPFKAGSTSNLLHVYKGNSLKITVDDPADPTAEVRNVRKIEIVFSSDANAINGADGISSSVSGTKTYDSYSRKFTWEGCARSVELFFDDVKASSGAKA